jgi:hypothetical protein
VAVARLGIWVLVVEVASLFAEPLNVGFGLLARWVNLLTNLGDVLVLTRRLYVNDETLLIGCANDPPISKSGIGKAEQESAYQYKPVYMKGPVQPPTSLILPWRTGASGLSSHASPTGGGINSALVAHPDFHLRGRCFSQNTPPRLHGRVSLLLRGFLHLGEELHCL